MSARIFQPIRKATQSGEAVRARWVLAFDLDSAREIDPLMGWTSSSDMRQQVKLWFETRDEAVDYARRNGIDARVEEPKPTARRIMAYADNFRASRRAQWTH